jgi:acetyl-CoA carboxylase carboxyl transferase subunit alpha
MANPEGYRKAIRLMDMAERFGLPVVMLVDTPGAYPGRGAEERGQAEAIASCTEKCLGLGTPLISVIVGEGGSGGAVALASANKVLMLEHSVYSVISPEGCASILWKDAAAKGESKSPEAAEAMKISADDLLGLGVIDAVIPEPIGGAHRDPALAIERLGDAVETAVHELEHMTPDQLRAHRRQKFLAIGRTGLNA